MNDATSICEPLEPAQRFELAVDEPPEARPGLRSQLKGAIRGMSWAVASVSDWVFGAAALVIGLAILSAIPIAQFLSFGYLLEAGGRVARTGKLRSGLVGVRKASRVGSMVIGARLFLLPLEVSSSLANSAQLVDPGGPAARAS